MACYLVTVKTIIDQYENLSVSLVDANGINEASKKYLQGECHGDLATSDF